MKNLGLAAGFVVLWSSGFIGAELGTRAAPAVTILAWRAVVAVTLLHGWSSWWRRKPMNGRDVGWLAVIGLFSQGGYLAGVVLAVEFGVPPGTVALIAALQPITASIAARPVLGEQVSRRQWLGLAVGLIGVGLVVHGDMAAAEAAPAWAYFLPFAAMASLVTGTLIERRVVIAASVIDSVRVQTAAAAVVFVAWAGGAGAIVPPADLGFWIAVAWTVVLSHFGGYLFYWLNLRRSGVARLGALLYVTPAATAVWALAMFGQPIPALAVVGMLICLASLRLVFVPRAVRIRESQPLRTG